MGTSTFEELSESLRFGEKRVNDASGKSSRSREQKSLVGVNLRKPVKVSEPKLSPVIGTG